jgi:hypothetical protein
MSNRNVDKGREAENAVAAVFRAHGMPHAERRAKRGGTVAILCPECGVVGLTRCATCGGRGDVLVPADAGDLTGVPGVVVQVKWSGYAPLATDMRRTDEQRLAAGAAVGLLVRKRPGVGCARAAEWDAYLPGWAVLALLSNTGADTSWPRDSTVDPYSVWHTDLETAVRVLASAGYGTPPN